MASSRDMCHSSEAQAAELIDKKRWREAGGMLNAAAGDQHYTAWPIH